MYDAIVNTHLRACMHVSMFVCTRCSSECEQALSEEDGRHLAIPASRTRSGPVPVPNCARDRHQTAEILDKGVIRRWVQPDLRTESQVSVNGIANAFMGPDPARREGVRSLRYLQVQRTRNRHAARPP